jgi:hypothetical protein
MDARDEAGMPVDEFLDQWGAARTAPDAVARLATSFLFFEVGV